VPKYRITDPAWVGEVLGGAFFLAALMVVSGVWVTSVHPFPDSVVSSVAYYAALVALAAGIVAQCVLGFKYRRTDVDEEGLSVRDGKCHIALKTKRIPRSEIAGVETYDEIRQGVFAHGKVSGIRVRLSDGSAIVLAETNGQGRYEQEAGKVRQVLGLPTK